MAGKGLDLSGRGVRGGHTGILKCSGPLCAAAFFLLSPSQFQHSASAPGSSLPGVPKPVWESEGVEQRREEPPGQPSHTGGCPRQGAPARALLLTVFSAPPRSATRLQARS